MPRKINATMPEVAVGIQGIKIPQSDGSFLIKPGVPIPCNDDVSVQRFSKMTGLRVRQIYELCEEGSIDHRRLTPAPRSRIRIPRSEIARYLQFKGNI
jgi:hypothetical protein